MSDVQNAFPSCSNKRFQKSLESKTEEEKNKKSEGEPGEGVFNKTLATAPPLLRQCACARARACVCVPRVGNTLHDGLVPPHGHAGVLGGDDD